MERAALREDEARIEMAVMLFGCCGQRKEVCSPHILYNRELFSKRDARTIWSRLGRLNTFDIYNCCQRNPSNGGNTVTLNVQIWEENQLCRVLVLLAAKEEGENMLDTRYSEASWATGDFIIPATWLQQVPFQGVVSLRYVSEKEEYMLHEFRRGLGVEYLNWGDAEKPAPKVVDEHGRPTRSGRRASVEL